MLPFITGSRDATFILNTLKNIKVPEFTPKSGKTLANRLFHNLPQGIWVIYEFEPLGVKIATNEQEAESERNDSGLYCFSS